MVFSTEWFTIEREIFEDVRNLEGKPFYRLKASDSVIVLATTPDKEIILVRQFRPAVLQHTLELPSGYIDSGETAKQAAARELYEETGFKCESMDYLGPGRIMMNRTDSMFYGFLGNGAVEDPGFRPQEEIEVVLTSRDDFKELIVGEQFQQLAAMALIALAEWKFGYKLINSVG